MSEWYYSEGNRQQRGPLASENLVALFRSGRIGLDTPVWRDGQAQWQPLGDFTVELGLTSSGGAPLPPPLPASTVRAAGVASSAPPRSGLSGCMIALIVAAVLAIPMIAILAAIALPAYQDYTLRAKTAGAMSVATPLKTAVAEHLNQHSTCPGNDAPGFGAPESYAAGNVASATIGEFESNRCGIELVLTATGSDKLDGKAVWFEYDPSASSWQCNSEIDDRYLPAQCRE
ncbi:MAG TPA: pilin [Pseudoxanthomonas sp.]